MFFYAMGVPCVLIIALLTVQGLGSTVEDNCSKSRYQKLGSKSAYRLLNNRPRHPISYPDCEPVQVYFVGRHGSRYPKAKMIEKFSKTLPLLRDAVVQSAENGKGFLCPGDIADLKNWSLNMDGSIGNTLAHEGALELQNIGKTLKAQFPMLFDETFTPQRYMFRTTIENRAIDSATNFSVGLFPTIRNSTYLRQFIVANNTLLRTYQKCQKWRQEVKAPSIKEKQAFVEKSDEFANVIPSVTERLGLKQMLSLDEIELLYSTCQFHTAIVRSTRGETSFWCHLFSDEDLKLLEYADDLKTYWRDGYGYSLTGQLACPIVEDIISQFRFVATSHLDNNYVSKLPIGFFNFAHSGTLLKLFTMLGFFKDDEHLLSTDYVRQQDRKWKTSAIDPFATNLQLVLFKCWTASATQLKVAAYIQQNEVLLPNCTSVLCPLETFFENYWHYLEICNLDMFCNVDRFSNIPFDSWLVEIVFCLFLAVCIGILYGIFRMWKKKQE